MRRILYVALLAVAASCTKPQSNNSNNGSGNGTNNNFKLAISGFTPTSGIFGDTLTINGTGFGNDTSKINITIGAKSNIHPFSATNTKLVLTIPKGATTSTIELNLGTRQKLGVDYTESDSQFTVIQPEPLSVTGLPTMIKIGDTLSLTGSGFGSDTNGIFVKFTPGIKVKPLHVSKSNLKVVIPMIYYNDRNNLQGLLFYDDLPWTKLTLIRGSDSITTNNSIEILPPNPVIIDFFPKTIKDGDTVRITGKYFFTAKEVTSTVYYLSFGVGNISVNRINDTSILTYIRGIDTIRKLPIAVLIRYSTSLLSIGPKSADSLTFMPNTQAYYISPSHAKVDELVRITGKFKVSDYPTMRVRFTGSSTDVTPELSGTQKDNEIYAKVPADAKTGPISVTIKGYVPGTTFNSIIIIP